MATRKKFVIQPFRARQTDPSRQEETWTHLKNSIYEIFRLNASNLSFEELYRLGYNLVLGQCGDKLYDGLHNTVNEQMLHVADLVASKADETLLDELKRRWDIHKVAMQMIRDILMYMDRTYVVTSKKTPVFELGLHLFWTTVLHDIRIQGRMHRLVIGLIHRERTGEVIDRGLMKGITGMLWELGTPVYLEDFEIPFLQASQEFYQAEALFYISFNSCPDYLRKAEERLKEEMNRVNHYMDLRTEPEIRKVLETELIERNMKTLVEMENSGLVSMLRDEKTEDLARMYSLFRQVPGGLDLIRQTLYDFLLQSGLELVNDEERTKDPSNFVQSLMDLRAKYDRLLHDALRNDRDLLKTINRAFENFVNQNVRAPEFLSLFLDDGLRRGFKDLREEEVDPVLDRIMILFRYLQDKDVFEKYYKQHLAKRLLLGRSVSEDAERGLIAKLKTECGYQFTSKLEGMFTDMRLSSDTMDAFRRSTQGRRVNNVELHVHVLTTGYWPTQNVACCILPSEITSCCEIFKRFYLASHTGRRLTWQTNMGTADLRGTFKARRHELSVSTYQMCILMLFNNQSQMTCDEILEATQIPVTDLKRALQSLSLAKYRVLTKEPKTKDVNGDDIFSFNDHFKCSLVKFKIGMVSQKESETEKTVTLQKVEEDRKPQIEAAIVRVMKSRKVLDHNNLIAEVTKQLSTRFASSPSAIKKRIESLIEREFLERLSDDRRRYRYLA